MKSSFRKAQKNEITEYYIYKKLSQNTDNKEILKQIAQKEKDHYNFWKQKTEQEVRSSKLKIWFYTILIKIFGMNFGLSLMESGEKLAQQVYKDLGDDPKIKEIIKDEQRHEEKLIQMIDKTKLEYTSSIVLGLMMH